MDIILADTHLTDNPLEEYRWGIFDFLEDLKEQYAIEDIFLLGDITEKKDNHSAKLVNRVVENLNSLADKINLLYILRGNHDGIDPEWPFFKFLNSNQNISYCAEPTYSTINYLFLPHSKDPVNEWQDILKKYIKDTDIIFMHQTVKGAKSSNGFALDGLDSDIFKSFKGLIFSGDIHTPQEIGNVVYVGSPFPVYFGDSFTGNIILLDGKKCERVEYPTIKRSMLELNWTETIDLDFKVNPKDQFKIKILVNRSDSGSFDSYKKEIKDYIESHGGIIVSIELKLAEEKNRIAKKRKFINTDPLTVFNRYVKAEGLDEYYHNKGKEFI